MSINAFPEDDIDYVSSEEDEDNAMEMLLELLAKTEASKQALKSSEEIGNA